MLPPLGTGQSVQWESNPHVYHGKVAGFRYIMAASALAVRLSKTAAVRSRVGGTRTLTSTLKRRVRYRYATTP